MWWKGFTRDYKPLKVLLIKRKISQNNVWRSTVDKNDGKRTKWHDILKGYRVEIYHICDWCRRKNEIEAICGKT